MRIVEFNGSTLVYEIWDSAGRDKAYERIYNIENLQWLMKVHLNTSDQ
jgi:hypothetical protein